jgi:uridine phosphorylase
VRLAIQVGTCGVVGEGVRPGDVVIPTEARGEDGVTRLYATEARVPASPRWSGVAADILESRDVRVRRGPTMTWPTLFNQPLETVREWLRKGYLGVDMETATTLAVARYFGVPGISMLVAWDEVLSGRSFVDPLPPEEAETFARADKAVFDVALDLVEQVALR